MKSILFVIPTLTQGGAERVFVTLLKYLDRKKFRPILLVVDTDEAVYMSEVPSDVTVIDLGRKRVRYALPCYFFTAGAFDQIFVFLQ